MFERSILWALAHQSPRIARIADWRIANWSLRFLDVVILDPMKPRFRQQVWNLDEKRRRTHPSGAWRI
eukprot:4069325-Alexandrium_andersonii.AAC.1